MSDDDLDLLTTEEVAAILRMKVRTVREYIKAGKLPHIDLDREYRIYRKDVKAFLTQRYKGIREDKNS